MSSLEFSCFLLVSIHVVFLNVGKSFDFVVGRLSLQYLIIRHVLARDRDELCSV